MNRTGLERHRSREACAGRAKSADQRSKTLTTLWKKSTRIATFEECRENLSEFKEAQQFQRLKAAVFADLNQLEESKRPKPESLAARDADLVLPGHRKHNCQPRQRQIDQ